MKKTYALRRALPILVAAVLLTAILVDVVAAGVKAVSPGALRPIRYPRAPSPCRYPTP